MCSPLQFFCPIFLLVWTSHYEEVSMIKLKRSGLFGKTGRVRDIVSSKSLWKIYDQNNGWVNFQWREDLVEAVSRVLRKLYGWLFLQLGKLLQSNLFLIGSRHICGRTFSKRIFMKIYQEYGISKSPKCRPFS